MYLTWGRCSCCFFSQVCLTCNTSSYNLSWAQPQLPPGCQGASGELSHSVNWSYAKRSRRGGKPRSLSPQWGNHSSLYVDMVYWVTSILVAWLLEHGHGDVNRGSWISVMLWALIQFVSRVKCSLAKWLNLLVWVYQRESLKFSEYLGQWALLRCPGGEGCVYWDVMCPVEGVMWWQAGVKSLD